MSSNDYIPTKEAQRQMWFNNFVSVAMSQQTALGLTAADVTALTTGMSGYGSAVSGSLTTRTAYHAANKTKIGANKTITATVRGIVRRVQANPAVTAAMKAQLQINTHTTPRTNTPPVAPASLEATAYADGTNALKWKTNGNKSTTVYAIEALYPGKTDFEFVDNTTATRYDHTGQMPGVMVVYRVVAMRAKMKSDPSNTAAVYLHSPQLTLLKAA